MKVENSSCRQLELRRSISTSIGIKSAFILFSCGQSVHGVGRGDQAFLLVWQDRWKKGGCAATGA